MADTPEQQSDPIDKSLGDQATGTDASHVARELSLGDQATSGDALSSMSDLVDDLGEAIDSGVPTDSVSAEDNGSDDSTGSNGAPVLDNFAPAESFTQAFKQHVIGMLPHPLRKHATKLICGMALLLYVFLFSCSMQWTTDAQGQALSVGECLFNALQILAAIMIISTCWILIYFVAKRNAAGFALRWIVPYSHSLATINPVRGKTYQEIRSLIGNAHSHTYAAHGKAVRQWLSVWLFWRGHVSLIFDENDVCLGINHEFSIL